MEVAVEVRNEMGSWKVASGFILAYRAMKKITENNGLNQWLSTGAPHLNVRNHHKPAKVGSVLKTGEPVPVCCECAPCLHLRARKGFTRAGCSNPASLLPHPHIPLAWYTKACGFYGSPVARAMCSKCALDDAAGE